MNFMLSNNYQINREICYDVTLNMLNIHKTFYRIIQKKHKLNKLI